VWDILSYIPFNKYHFVAASMHNNDKHAASRSTLHKNSNNPTAHHYITGHLGIGAEHFSCRGVQKSGDAREGA